MSTGDTSNMSIGTTQWFIVQSQSVMSKMCVNVCINVCASHTSVCAWVHVTLEAISGLQTQFVLFFFFFFFLLVVANN